MFDTETGKEAFKFLHGFLTRETAHELIVDRVIGDLMIGTAIAAFISRRAHKKDMRESHELLRLQKAGEAEASMTMIIYSPICGTDKFEQQVKEGKLINFEDIFPKGQWPAISEYLQAARALCTDADPIVFNHLDKVIPPEETQSDKEEILRHWYAHFDEMYNPMAKIPISANDALSYASPTYLGKKKQYSENKSAIYPILVSEPSAKHQRMRIFIMNDGQLKNGQGLKESNVMIQNQTAPDPEFKNPAYHYLRTLRAISDMFWQYKLDPLLNAMRISVTCLPTRAVSNSKVPAQLTA